MLILVLTIDPEWLSRTFRMAITFNNIHLYHGHRSNFQCIQLLCLVLNSSLKHSRLRPESYLSRTWSPLSYLCSTLFPGRAWRPHPRLPNAVVSRQHSTIFHPKYDQLSPFSITFCLLYYRKSPMVSRPNARIQA